MGMTKAEGMPEKTHGERSDSGIEAIVRVK